MRTARRSKSNRVDWALALDRPKLEEPLLRVDSIMSRNVFTCRAGDSLNVAARLMWEHDCGSVPVVDAAGHVVGMITDRDICMAAYLQGKTLNEIAVSSACSREVHSCHPEDPASHAASIMARAQVRRLPVVDAYGQLIGVITLGDLARNFCFARSQTGLADASERMVSLLKAVSRPRPKPVESLPHMTSDEKECLASFDPP